MDAWICESCGATNKQKDKPIRCNLCNRKTDFTKINIEEKKDEISEKYDEALKKLESYEEGVPKRKITDYACKSNVCER